MKKKTIFTAAQIANLKVRTAVRGGAVPAEECRK